METIYNVQYFINKFSAISDDMWISGSLNNGRACCALGHCGVLEQNIGEEGEINHSEGEALAILLSIVHPSNNNFAVVYKLNDGYLTKYPQPTPKERILAALYDVKAIQEKENILASEELINKALQSGDPEDIEDNGSDIHPEWKIKQIGNIEVSELI